MEQSVGNAGLALLVELPIPVQEQEPVAPNHRERSFGESSNLTSKIVL